MIVSPRFQFNNGINVVGDKGIIGPGWLTVADNVDLRSGVPRPIPSPRPIPVVVDSDTVCIYKRRGKWYQSSLYRDYAAEYINSRDRIYYTEHGNIPYKEIEGTSAPLGTPKPRVAPLAARASSLCPYIVSIAATANGSLSPNITRSYRVAAETVDGIMPACPPVNTFLTDLAVPPVANKSVTITWARVEGATRYHIFSGNGEGEREMDSVSSSYNTYTDYGGRSASGPLATVYDNDASLTYVYTFLREINTVQDESGPSPASGLVTSTSGRVITFDAAHDGLFSQPATRGIIAANLTVLSTPSVYPSATVISATYNSLTNGTKFVTSTPLGLAYKDKVHFELGDAAWNGVDFVVTPDMSDSTGKTFYVSGMTAPTPITGTVTPAKTRVRALGAAFSGNGPLDKDVVRVALAGSSFSGTAIGTYKTTWIDATTISLNLYTPSTGTPLHFVDAVGLNGTNYGMVFTQGNGGLKYRNLYRSGDTSQFQLVKQVPIDETTYVDAKPASALGDLPDSYYLDGSGNPIIFDVPPKGMTNITSHYGMLFGIDGNDVRWTPVGKPDAWPRGFVLNFEYKPVALVSTDQCMVVLCTDKVRRIDGNDPSQLQLSDTSANIGCIAPWSAQKTELGLIYLSSSGLMLFDGQHARCITDVRIPPHVLRGASAQLSASDYLFQPTVTTYLYGALSEEDGTLGSIKTANFHSTNPVDGIVYDVRSFYYNGKYYMYWVNKSTAGFLPNVAGNYQSHTTICVDLRVQGFPVTTLSMKPWDVFVDDQQKAYVLGNMPNDMTEFVYRQANMIADVQESGGEYGKTKFIYDFDGNRDVLIPYHVRTGQQTLGSPTAQKRFYGVKIYSEHYRGELHVRVYVDDKYVCDGRVTPYSNAQKSVMINLPNGRSTGYSIDVEVAGTVPIRAFEFVYDTVVTTANGAVLSAQNNQLIPKGLNYFSYGEE